MERWWPRADVLPHAAVVVGHGGFGTTHAALVAGVPQVVLPLFSVDQCINARRVEAGGVGRAVMDPHAADLPAAAPFPDGPAAASGVGEAAADARADPTWRTRAAALAAGVDELPTTDGVVAGLPDMVGRG